ncbi:hypothetical protein Nepgr_032422 [Nepenthes gracilis]|uniref:LIM zinc-binding domain-containing protein n=1 Tax=Nepenthes gracilis TaxID=150966 RepID=A0AAD3TJZ3_NEPGR|nr:hypothetical protein Nepgr_032422 [Nepenthes gracilis]
MFMGSSDFNHISYPRIHGFAYSSIERDSGVVEMLSDIFNIGSSHGFAGSRHPRFLEDGNMFWPVHSRLTDNRSKEEKDREELNRAIALSLAEDSRRPNGSRQRMDIDEEPARELLDSLTRPSYPPYRRSNTQITVPCNPGGHRICGGCNQEIGYGNYLQCMNTYFHPECFRCLGCGHPIVEQEFSLSGRDPYHKSCFKERTHPKCEVCHQFIPTNSAGLIEYRCLPFWSQKYCPKHEHDKTARCCSCERLESRNARYIPLGDGRSSCSECMEFAIMDTADCQPLYQAVRDYYESKNMGLDQRIPVLLVETQALNEAIAGEKNGSHHMPETRGLCLSEEQTVISVLRRPSFGGHLFRMRTQPQRLARICEVTAILILFGLPRLLTGAILAHELMHAWLRLKGFRNLKPEVEEGICQVLSYMWLESEMKRDFRSIPSISTHSFSSSSSLSSSDFRSGRKSEVEKKLGEFFLHQITTDSSQAYGGGFRVANAAVSKYGLSYTLDHIRSTGSFPL